MAGMKMKRKELEEVNDDFSDFSLSSPARKIRRLDAELPPIMEEEEPIPSTMEQVGGSGPIIEELPENEERALVLFKPMATPLLLSPSNFSVSVNSDVISGIKSQIVWSAHSNTMKSAEDEAAIQGSNTRGTNESLAVVPWVPSQIPSIPRAEVPQTEVSELMEYEDMGAATMDIEENNVVSDQGQVCEFSGMRDGFHHWPQQQHCMIPQLPQSTSSPIVWFR